MSGNGSTAENTETPTTLPCPAAFFVVFVLESEDSKNLRKNEKILKYFLKIIIKFFSIMAFPKSSKNIFNLLLDSFF